MAFTKSTVVTTNISDLPDQPTISATELKAKFDKYGADDKPFVNGLIDELEAVTGGTSLGTNATGVTATNVTDALAENRVLIDSIGGDITTLEGRVTTNEGNITTIDGRVTVNEGDITTLEGRVTVNEGDITTIEGNAATLAGRVTVNEGDISTLQIGKADKSNVLEKDNTTSFTPSADYQPSTKKYVDDEITGVVLGDIPDNSLTNVKLATDVKIGSLATLITTVKTSVTNAINEIVTNIGSLLSLTTADKSSVVNAINEVDLKSLTPKQTGGGYLINGDFSINQRSVSGTVVLLAGEYGHDRFKAGASGCTYTFASSGGVITLTISTGSLIQVIEGANLDSETYVLSWEGTSQGKIGAGTFSASGVTGVVIGGSNLNIEFNTGTLTKCKFENGTIPTTFIHNTFTGELNRCLRYYEKSYEYSIKPGTSSVSNGAIAEILGLNPIPNGQLYSTQMFKTKKRIRPTIKIFSYIGTESVVTSLSTNADFPTGSAQILLKSENNFGLRNNTGVGLTDNLTGVLYHFTADAEI